MAIDYKNGGTISYDTKKFFKGNFKDLRSDLASDFLQTILVATTIRIKETDEGIKEIESFYPYLFAPGSYYKLVVNKKDKQFTQEDIDAIRLKEKNNKEKIGKKAWISPLEQIILKMSDADYGCKDVYHLGVLKEFVSGEHIETSDTAIVTDEDYGDTSKY
jgi:hypothetical protein